VIAVSRSQTSSVLVKFDFGGALVVIGIGQFVEQLYLSLGAASFARIQARPGKLLFPLIKAVQELSTMVEAQNGTIAALKARLDSAG
jgi:hypothetical protein